MAAANTKAAKNAVLTVVPPNAPEPSRPELCAILLTLRVKWRGLLELKLHAGIARHVERAGGPFAEEYALGIDLGVREDGRLNGVGASAREVVACRLRDRDPLAQRFLDEGDVR